MPSPPPRCRRTGSSSPSETLFGRGGGPLRHARQDVPLSLHAGAASIGLPPLDEGYPSPPSLAAHARLANLDGGRLVYVVDAPVWRAKLRLVAPALLDAARSLGLGVAELVVKTTTDPIHPSKRTEPKATPMSAAAKEALQFALASLKDPEDAGSK